MLIYSYPMLMREIRSCEWTCLVFAVQRTPGLKVLLACPGNLQVGFCHASDAAMSVLIEG